ncbi:MAG: helix-turn-helix domain-containing protein [Clostridia bacterium]|nr:helix-turn-helix domain-containing protein [Clostridia bacterium]
MDTYILQRLSAITEEEQKILSGSSIDRALYMDGSRDIITGNKLLEKGRQIAVRPHTRFVHFPEHTHDYVEIVYMCQGETRHIVNGAFIPLKQGELLMLGQHARQEIEPAGEGDIAVNFIVRPEFFQGILSFLGNEETPLRRFILGSLAGDTDTGYLYFQVSQVLPVQNLVENLLWTMLTDHANRRGIYQMTMGLLMAELLEHTESLRFSSPEEETTLRVLRYIEEHYRSGSLTELADLLHYDFSALSRLIRNRTGKNYTALVQQKRLSQAAWLLRNTDEQVEKIALLVGYENSSYFHRLFVQQFGQSPKRFRDCK